MLAHFENIPINFSASFLVFCNKKLNNRLCHAQKPVDTAFVEVSIHQTLRSNSTAMRLPHAVRCNTRTAHRFHQKVYIVLINEANENHAKYRPEIQISLTKIRFS